VIAVWTGLGLLGALVVQTALARLLPGYAWLLDPFLLVLVYCGLTGGETRGMLAGLVAGWVQDVHFGGSVLGLSGLAKLVVGFGVGLAGSRFMLTGTLPRLAVLFAASLADAVLLERLAALFDLPVGKLSLAGLLYRAAVTAAAGVAAFAVLDRHSRTKGRG
jgi:rod shape-determining protein MreD